MRKLIRKFVMKYLWHRYKVAYKNKSAVVGCGPREAWIEPTNHCNLRCVMCPQSKGLKVAKGYMDIALYTKVLNELARARVQRINLFMGGESLLHKDLLKMVSMAKDRDIPLRIHTNATILTGNLAKGLLESGALEEISFSFDGEDPEQYEKIRVNAKFDKTLANIVRFLELKKELRMATPRVLIQVIKEANPDGSAPDVSEKIKALFAGLPVDRFAPICFHNFGGTLDTDGAIRYELQKRVYSPCRHLWRSINVAWDGEVVGCCIDMDKKMVLGDLKIQSAMEVWNGEPMRRFRSALAEGRYKEVELCAECDQLWKT